MPAPVGTIHRTGGSHGNPITTDATTDEPVGLTRRGLLRGGAAGALGLAISGSLGGLARAGGAAAAAEPPTGVGYGPLVTDPAGLLSLPKRFHYRVVAETGVTRLESGEVSPDNYDGTAAFVRAGVAASWWPTTRSGRRHRQIPPDRRPARRGCDLRQRRARRHHDDRGRRRRQPGDGVREPRRHQHQLRRRPTPWNTWLTCEETFTPAGATKRHGYVFEVDPHDRSANEDPTPIVALGRFEHEAVAVDPDTGQVYQTEDSTTRTACSIGGRRPTTRCRWARGCCGAWHRTPGCSRRCRPTTRQGRSSPTSA